MALSFAQVQWGQNPVDIYGFTVDNPGSTNWPRGKEVRVNLVVWTDNSEEFWFILVEPLDEIYHFIEFVEIGYAFPPIANDSPIVIFWIEKKGSRHVRGEPGVVNIEILRR